jgi:hypothetical protein
VSLTMQDGLSWAGCPWELDFFQRGPTAVHVAYHPPDVRVRVCDRTSGTAGRSETHARLSADGTVRLGAHQAPPALLVASTGARLVPSVSGIDEIATMGDDDVLILCSVCVLEHLPAGFTRLVDVSIPSQGRDLLSALLHLTATGAGCAVVARRRPLGVSPPEKTCPQRTS